MKMQKKLLTASLAAFGMTLGMLSMSTMAEEKAGKTQGAAADSIEEVIVTARRKEENLQAVPISVTVISGEALTQKGVSSPYDLDQHVPSLTMGLSGSHTKGLMFGIRGLRHTSLLLLDDPPVGTYYAETPVAHPWGFGETFFDIQSMQVLKGPQGTLFGRNTTGGAVLIEPNKPSFEEGFNGSIKAALGDYNMQQLTGMINIPINDVAALRIAGEHKERDGYTKNILSGQKRDGIGYDALRIGLTLKPTRDITSTTIVDYLTEDGDPTAQQLTAVYGPNGGAGLGAGISNVLLNQILREQQARGPYNIAMIGGTNFVLPTTDPRYAVTGQDQMSPLKCDPSSPFFVPNHYCRKHMQPKQTLTNFGLLNNTSIDFNGTTLKNIISFRHAKVAFEDSSSFPFALQGNGSVTGQFNGLAGSATQASIAAGGMADANNVLSQFTEELQLQGKAANDKLEWVTGLFYMREWGDDFSPSYTNSPNWSMTAGYGRNLSKGAFAQGSYAVTDKLKWTLGYRKNWDNRNATDTSTATNGTICQAIQNGVRMSRQNCAMNDERNFSAGTYTAGLDYKVNDDTMVYVLRSRGYKAGGFSLRSHNNATWAYEPEYVINNEVGIKSDWTLMDRPVRTNLSVFKSKVTNQQLQATVAGSNPVLTNVQNIGKAEVFGFEFEYILKATSNLEISGYYSYIDPKYTKWDQFTGSALYGTVDLSYRPFQFTSFKNAGITVDYKLPLDSSIGTIKLRADASFHSKWETDNRQAGLVGLAAGVNGAIPTVQGFTQMDRAGYGILNLRADWQRPFGSPVDLGLFVTNANDRVYYLGGSSLNGFTTSPIAAPRMFGVELSYRFGDGFKPKD